MIEKLCACGCGKRLYNKHKYSNGKYLNQKHYARHREKLRAENGYYEMIKKEKKQTKVTKEKQPIKFDGKMYCEHYDKNYYNCVNCMEQAVFKYKSCYKEVIR